MVDILYSDPPGENWEVPSTVGNHTWVDPPLENCVCGGEPGYSIWHADPVHIRAHCRQCGARTRGYVEVTGWGAEDSWKAVGTDWRLLQATLTGALIDDSALAPDRQSTMSDAEVAALRTVLTYLVAEGEACPGTSRINTAKNLLQKVLAGFDTKDVVNRLSEIISVELALQRDELEATRENIFAEVEKERATVEELRAFYEARLAQVAREVETKAEARVVEILAEREAAAATVRRVARPVRQLQLEGDK